MPVSVVPESARAKPTAPPSSPEVDGAGEVDALPGDFVCPITLEVIMRP